MNMNFPRQGHLIAPFANGWRLAGVLVLFKVAYLVLLSWALVFWPTFEEGNISPSSRQRWTSDGHLTLGSHFVAWNAQHYLFLSEEGYKHGFPQCAFYPLYPLLIRWVSTVTRGDDVLIAMILANLFSLGAWVLFFQMAARRYGEASAALALALLLAFPGSLFFQFIYTESLFFLLLMLFCLALEGEHLALALLTAFSLPLTRAVGIFCVFPLVWRLFFGSPPIWWKSLANRHSRVGRIVRLLGPRGGELLGLKSPNWSRANAVSLILAPLLGWFTYFLLMWKYTGNVFEGIKAQEQFGGVESIHHLFDPVWFVKQMFNPMDWHGYTGSLLDRCVFILLMYFFPLIWKLDKSWCIWAFFLGVVPAVSGGFTSFTRFASVVFPLFIALGVYLSKPGVRCWRWLVLATFAVLHVILVWRFVNFRWAG
jgi:hypothetical protein